MFFRRIRLHLVLCHFQCLDQTFAGLSRIDDFVDESQFGSLIRSSKLFFVSFQFFTFCLCIRFAEQDVYRTFRTHYCNFCTWVSEVHVSSGLLGVHHNICAAVCLARNHRNLRNGSFGVSINYFRPVADDAVVLLRISGKKSRHIFESNQRNVETVAETDETACLVAGVNVENTGKVGRLIGDNTNRTACQTCKTDDDILCEVESLLRRNSRYLLPVR